MRIWKMEYFRHLILPQPTHTTRTPLLHPQQRHQLLSLPLPSSSFFSACSQLPFLEQRLSPSDFRVGEGLAWMVFLLFCYFADLFLDQQFS